MKVSNIQSPWPMAYELLWFRTGLDPSTTTEVVMTNLADSKMALDFVLFTTSTDTIAKMYVLCFDGKLTVDHPRPLPPNPLPIPSLARLSSFSSSPFS